MDWFEKLTGFREAGYEETRARLEIAGRRLRSRINGASYEIGELELVSLQNSPRKSGSWSPPGWPDQDKCSDRRCTANAPIS